MRFVRENLFYVILVGVVVLGLAGAVLYYTGSGIDKSVQARQNLSDEIRALASKDLKVDANAVAAMQRRIDALAAANKADQQQCILFNRRNLPVLKIPVGAASEVDATPFDPKRYQEQALTIPFITKVNRTLDQLLAQPALAPTQPPTQEQINEEVGKLTDKFKEQNPAEVQEKATRSMILQQSLAGMIYVDPAVLDRVLQQGSTFATPDKLWEAQVNLWVTDEIIRAIIAANQQWLAQQREMSGHDVPAGVPNSAVKQLVELAITETIAGPGGAPLAPRPSLSMRQTNAKYAVVPYRFRVVMPSRHVRLLVNTLESQNYHTVTNITLSEAVPPIQNKLYFGTEPVMTVVIEGELLLLGDWIRDVVPAAFAGMFGGRAES